MLDTNLRIDEIDRGLLVDQINEHLAQCVFDIADVNKEATKKREVVITIAFHPAKSRREAAVKYDVKLKPSTHIAREPTMVFLGKNSGGEIVAKPWVPDQQELPGVSDAISAGEGAN